MHAMSDKSQCSFVLIHEARILSFLGFREFKIQLENDDWLAGRKTWRRNLKSNCEISPFGKIFRRRDGWESPFAGINFNVET